MAEENVAGTGTEEGGSLDQSGQAGSDSTQSQGGGDKGAGEGEGQEQTQTQPIEVGGKTFNSVDDLVNSYTSLESRMGELRNEVGTLRQAQQQPVQQPQEQQPNFGEQISDVKAKLDAGEISVGEALELQSQIATEQASAIATRQFQEATEQKAIDDAYNSFLQENPNFEQLRSSGELAKVRANNPLDDDYTAYWKHKAQEAVKDVEAAASKAVEKAKTEWANAKKGTEETAGRTLDGSGGAAQRQPAQEDRKLSDAEEEAAMLAE